MAEIESIIQDIILHELALPTDYGTVNSKIVPSVYIVAPNVSLGSTDKLQIGIQSIDSKIISNRPEIEYTTNSTSGQIVATQYNVALLNDMIQIDISSRNNDARLRRHEVFMALNSYYSQQKQEDNNCKIFNIPGSFHNTSAAEGGTTIYRYTITFMVQYLRRYSHVISSNDYYDKFGTQVDVEEEADVFGFTIPKEST